LGSDFYFGLGWFLLAGGLCLLFAWWLKRTLLGLFSHAFGANTLSLGLYALLTLPGFFLHEGAHALTALILRVPVRDVTFIPRPDPYSLSISASVQIAHRDAFRMALIALAPLLAGTVVLGLLTGITGTGVQDIRPWVRLQMWFSGMNRQGTSLWTTVYLIWTVSSHMAPSRPDLRYAQRGFLIMLIVLAALLFLLPLFGKDLPESLGLSLGRLGDGLAIGALLNGLVLIPLALLSKFVRRYR
jgi:hypothetical protein